MGRRRTSTTEGRGRLTAGPGKGDGLVPRTLEFIRVQLSAWRDDPSRPEGANEKALNSTLCDFLDVQSRTLHPMVRFKHESLQTTVHSADIGVHGVEQETVIGALDFSIYQPFLVIEAKRLPTPSKDREREYVTGSNDGKPTGGIQRFKLGLHGAGVDTGALVGYLEKEKPAHWHRTINEWIAELAGTTVNGCVWAASESIKEPLIDDANGIAMSVSTHGRAVGCVTESITLHHFWVEMDRPKENDASRGRS